MSSLVSDFIINPVLRQARRFSEISRATLTGDGNETTPPTATDAVSDSSLTEDAVHEAPARPNTDPVIRPETPQPWPVSSSTQDIRVEEVMESPLTIDEAPHDHLGFPLSPKRGRGIPEDDGMREMRKRIQAINAQDVSSSEKARRMHELLLENYRASQLSGRGDVHTVPVDEVLLDRAWEPSTSPGPLESLKSWYNQGTEQAERFMLSKSDLAPTFAPLRQRKSSDAEVPSHAHNLSASQELQAPLGCQHYERNVKLQCFTCKKWYTCRFCHDAQEDHGLIRRQTRNMLCMLCGTPQRASDMCINCGEIAAHYYCGICKLWENRKSKPIYHCNDCGICRRGLGLGKDFFHCKTCRACITTSIESSHKCIERSTDCDCPICGEYMFTSPKPVVFMTCGHSIHKKCYDQHMKVSYKCPICNKSLANMETQFRNLDVAILSQPMPVEFRDTKATILCNDCSGKCVVPYHWLGLKCSICQSYNTVELQIHGQGSQSLQTATERAEEAASSAQGLQPDNGQRTITSSGTAAIPTSSRGAAWIPNRRRHSSHGVELQHRAPDRFARSLSPLESVIDSQLGPVAADVDSDDDIFGFWRGNRDVPQEEEEGDLSDEESDSDQDSDVILGADDDDDDEDDDILLIGHR